VVAYCKTGNWAATDWFVLSVVLGRPDVRLDDGSMVEWTADPHLTSPSSGRPVSPEDFAGAGAPCGAPCPSAQKK
jgi:3-mercaptopyruvate sulfurtransferase SseA